MAKFPRDLSVPGDLPSKRKGRAGALGGLNQSLLHLEAGGKTQF
jgi:hypothetical protein